MTYGPINYNGKWITRYNNELYTLHDKSDTLKVIKIGRERGDWDISLECKIWIHAESSFCFNQKTLGV
jgi:hypothetical protein